MKKSIKWFEDQDDILIEKYLFGTPVADIANSLGKTKRSVGHRISKLGLKREKTLGIKHDYFDKWSSNMAYILGLIITDGCVSINRLQFCLGIKDKCLLDFIKSEISPNTKITVYTNKKGKTLCCLKITSKQIIAKLKSFGVIERKTGKEILPKCPNEFYPDLLRGLIDGDGCIHRIKGYNRNILSLYSANPKFLKQVKSSTFDFGHLYKKDTNCYVWKVFNQKEIKTIYNLVYNNGFYLKRKKENFYV